MALNDKFIQKTRHHCAEEIAQLRDALSLNYTLISAQASEHDIALQTERTQSKLGILLDKIESFHTRLSSDTKTIVEMNRILTKEITTEATQLNQDLIKRFSGQKDSGLSGQKREKNDLNTTLKNLGITPNKGGRSPND